MKFPFHSFATLHLEAVSQRKPLQLHLTIKKSMAKRDICGQLFTLVAKNLVNPCD